MLDQDKLNKLPQYAKNEILALREKVEKLEAEVKWLRDENRVKVEASNTIVAEGIDDNTALPPFSNIEFHLPNASSRRWKSAITVRVSRDGTTIDVMGTDALAIIPKVTNHFLIGFAE